MKKLVGIYNNVTLREEKKPVSVFPVYTDGENYFLKCMSNNLNNLLEVLKSLHDKREIEEEIDAYINKDNSLYSNKLIRYNDDSNYYYYLCPSSLLQMSQFYPLEQFSNIKTETIKEDYSKNTYAVIDQDNQLIVGCFDFIRKYISSIMNMDILKISRQEELIKKVNSLLEINKFFA